MTSQLRMKGDPKSSIRICDRGKECSYSRGKGCFVDEAAVRAQLSEQVT